MADQNETSMVELNVGGIHYTTTMATLLKYPESMLARAMNQLVQRGWRYEARRDPRGRDEEDLKVAETESADGRTSLRVFVESNNRIFVDRDGALFRFVLDFLRQGSRFSLPERFAENERLSCEAEFYGLEELARVAAEAKDKSRGHEGLPPVAVPSPAGSESGAGGSPMAKGNEIPGSPAMFSPGLFPPQVSPFAGQGQPSETGTITVGYRGTFAFGRDGGMADVKFRKLHRILIAGRVQLCKEVFGDTLNESRDPDRGGQDRYTSRFFLKHVFLEQAFDMLYEAGFRMVGSCGSGTNSIGDSKPGMDSEESKWLHYNEFVFVRS